MKKRYVIFGAAGFIGARIHRILKDELKFDTLGLTRREIDFCSPEAKSYIADHIFDGDVLIFAAALAPAKNLGMVTENITLINNLVEGVRDKKLEYVLNVSSDAVYGDPLEKISESSEIAPQSAHGIMHCMREKIIDDSISCPVGHIRPTLVFGKDDPHNGYGPNQFLRRVSGGDDIELFGEGEELRDHIFIGDVAEIAIKMIDIGFLGKLNAVTGTVMSFQEIATIAAELAEKSISIVNCERNGPMPHNGYRAFDSSKVHELMGDFQFKDLKSYIVENLRGGKEV